MSLRKSDLCGVIVSTFIIVASIIHTHATRKKTISLPPTSTAEPIASSSSLANKGDLSTIESNLNQALSSENLSSTTTTDTTQEDSHNHCCGVKKRKKHTPLPVKSLPLPIIICPLSGVLFAEDTNVIANKIGLSRVASYTLKHWKNPSDKFFTILQKMAQEHNDPHTYQMKYNGYIMPQCFLALQLGKSTHEEVIKKVIAYIDHLEKQSFFSDAEEYDLMKTIVHIILDPKEFSDISKPNTAMIDLLKKVKAHNNCSLYILTNISTEINTILSSVYHDIFSLFDGVITSSEMHMLKHNEKMFKHILDVTHTQPEHCLVIDSDQEVIACAKQLGIPTISFVSLKDTKQRLKTLGLL